jgi:ribosomal protein S15P/S13E
LQQSLYTAAGRLLSQVAGAVLLLLADHDRRRLDRHLPVLTASARNLTEHLAAARLPSASQQLLQSVQERLSAIATWLQQSGSPDKLSDRDIDATLSELQRLRGMLISAGEQSCQFSMITFASGCCCGSHDARHDVRSDARVATA